MRASAARCWLFVLVLLQQLLWVDVAGQPGKGPEGVRALRQTVVVTGKEVVGVPHGDSTLLDCSGFAGPAYSVVRGGSLLLQNVILRGCQQQAIVVTGPDASFTARDVVFSHHGSGSSKQHGIIISAQHAVVTLDHVTVVNNQGALQRQEPGVHAACSAADLQHLSSSSTSAACGQPLINSSLIHLQDSSLTAVHTVITANTAGALIAATGNRQHSLQLLAGTRVVGNTAAWGIVADSFASDPAGRAYLMEPHPSDKRAQEKHEQYPPVLTTYEFLRTVKFMKNWKTELPRALAAPSVGHFVGHAPKAQSPLQVRLQAADISLNAVIGGLMWLRLVNTSMSDVNITNNIVLTATEQLSQPACTDLLVQPASTPANSQQPTAAAVQRCSDAVRSAVSGLTAPHVCDMRAQDNALLAVHGPAAFDVHRSTISGNVHLRGAILRATDGMALTSVRSSSLSNNIATAVVRLEGRAWVQHLKEFMEATRSLDIDLFTNSVENTSPETFMAWYLPKHKKAQEKKDNSSSDASLYIFNSSLTHNKVFHAVVLVKGERRDWQRYEHAKAQAVIRAGRPEAAANVSLDTFSASAWLSSVTMNDNMFLRSVGHNNCIELRDTPYEVALAAALTGRLHERGEWAANYSKCCRTIRQKAGDPSPKAHNVEAAVFASTFAQNVLNGQLTGNLGFPHAVSLHSTHTVANMRVAANTLTSSAVRIADNEVQMYGTVLDGNRIHSGSVLSGRRISLTGNFSGVVVSNNMLVNTHKPPAKAWPVVELPQLYLASIDDIRIVNNTGAGWSYALELSDFNLVKDLSGVTVANNTASGIRMVDIHPWYDTQSVVLRDVKVVNNRLTEEGGGLYISGFSSQVGHRMRVELHNCAFVNNTPAQGHRQALPRSGGVWLKGPAEDTSVGDPARGYLDSLSFVIKNTRIEGNRGSEGAGLWSAWPMRVHGSIIRNNTAAGAGGGIFLQGLQEDKLGLGTSCITDTVVDGNSAAFGGGLACDRCRVLLYRSSVSGNMAKDPAPLLQLVGSGAATQSCDERASQGVGVDKSGGMGMGRQFGAGGSGGNCSTNAGPQLMFRSQHLLDPAPGFGGAMAVLSSGHSFVRVCGPASMTGNKADVIGGLLFLNHTGALCNNSCSRGPTGCPVLPSQGDVCAGGQQGGDGLQLCGVVLSGVDWTDTRGGSIDGHVLAWAGPLSAEAFSMHCTDTKPGIQQSPRLPPLQASDAAAQPTKGSCGCGENFTHAHRPGVPLANVTRPLPTQATLFDTGCLQQLSQQPGASSPEVCRLQGEGPSHPWLRAFAGDAVNFTVSVRSRFSHFKQWGVACSPSAQASAGVHQQSFLLEQGNDGMFAIANNSAVVGPGGLATFCNVALEPVSPPVANHNYTFIIMPSSSSHVLQQLPAVTIHVQLMRCTLGQHMMVNRCVRCANGTFSLNYSQPCHPCLPGATCFEGLLQPAEGYWSYTPFVPEVLPCLLRGACVSRDFTTQQLQALTPWVGASDGGFSRLYVDGAVKRAQEAAAAEALKARTAQRGLLSSNATDRLDMCQGLSVGGRGLNTSSSDPGTCTRTEALLQYNQWLACLLAVDPEPEGPPKLYATSYRGLLSSWHGIQCNTGFKGPMCSSCDAQVQEQDGDTNSTRTRRFALHRGTCVDCQGTTTVTWVVLAVLFVLLWAYVGLGIVCQISSVDSAMLHSAAASAYGVGSQALQVQVQGSEQPTLSATTAAAAAVPGASSTSSSSQRQGLILSWHAGPTSHARQQLVETIDGPATCDPCGGQPPQPQGRASRPCTADSPVRAIVATWKVLTSYVQVLAMIRFLPSFWDTYAHLLAVTDLSSFAQLAAVDCVLPDGWGAIKQGAGQQADAAGSFAYARLLLAAFGVPALLLLAFLVLWVCKWLLHKACNKQQPAFPPDSPSSYGTGQTAPLPWFSLKLKSYLSGVSSATATGHTGAFPKPPAVPLSSASGTVPPPSAAPIVAAPANQFEPHSPAGSPRSVASSTRGSWAGSSILSMQFTGPQQQLPPLHRYLSRRMAVTAVVLGYVCYSLFTSSMLQALACHPIQEVAGSSAVVAEYQLLHTAWRLQRLAELTQISKELRAAGGPNLNPANVEPSPVKAGQYYWKQDYGVRCYEGGHLAMTVVGAIFLAVVGVALPVVLGVLLWRTRDTLWEPTFSAKYSFLYFEYDSVCYYEFVIMGRKLVYLSIFLALTPQLPRPDDVVLLQLLTASVLGLASLLLNFYLRPFHSPFLNHLECAGLTTVTLTFLLLGVSMTANTEHATGQAGRVALLGIAGALNLGLVCFFLWQLAVLIRKSCGRSASVFLKRRMRMGRVWARRVGARVRGLCSRFRPGSQY